ncbi:hypothetical protein L873DRAFT_1798857 [Choiromyces venosus 120613-1]|uniref:Uncharacterized protein n=1 Tax=Choiromyces venosus 120613-1 TaxID=1336337 RepID=A0A3N4K1Y0_9PEZI|nr:hypothetical protein L873DRAFT_1798857 [Choiromyces venosus 120613-1]
MREKITGEGVKAGLTKAGMREKLVQWENSNVKCSQGDDGVLNIYLLEMHSQENVTTSGLVPPYHWWKCFTIAVC